MSLRRKIDLAVVDESKASAVEQLVLAQVVQHFSNQYIDALFGQPAAEWLARKEQAMTDLWELVELEGSDRRRQMLAMLEAEAAREQREHLEKRAKRREGNRRLKRPPRRRERTMTPDMRVAVLEVDTILNRLAPHITVSRELMRELGLSVLPKLTEAILEPRRVEVRLKTGAKTSIAWVVSSGVLLGWESGESERSGSNGRAPETSENPGGLGSVKNNLFGEKASGRDG